MNKIDATLLIVAGVVIALLGIPQGVEPTGNILEIVDGSGSWPVTVTGSNRIALAFSAYNNEDSTDTESVSLGAQSFTRIGGTMLTGKITCEAWGLIAPALGAADLTVTMVSDLDADFIVVSLDDASQAALPANPFTVVGSQVSELSLPVVAGDAVIIAVFTPHGSPASSAPSGFEVITQGVGGMGANVACYHRDEAMSGAVTLDFGAPADSVVIMIGLDNV